MMAVRFLLAVLELEYGALAATKRSITFSNLDTRTHLINV